MDAVNGWLGRLFARENVDRTVAELVASQEGGRTLPSGREAAKDRLDAAEAKLRRFQAAIEAGIDPAALVEAINEAQAQRAAARAELDNAPAPNTLRDAEVYAMIDSLGNVGEALANPKRESLENLYTAVDLQVRYEHETRAADVIIRPPARVNSARVRGGT
jgi:hypothetical protein